MNSQSKAKFIIPFFLLLLSTAHAADFNVSTDSASTQGHMTEQNVYHGLGCSGANLSPQLSWSNPPANAKSYGLTMYDPDASTGGWWHWALFNLPASLHELPEGASKNHLLLPLGSREGLNDFGDLGYGGACPPAGEPPHHYIITIYALKIDHLELPESTASAVIDTQLKRYAITKTSLTLLYGR